MPTPAQYAFIEFDVFDEMDQPLEVSIFIIGHTSVKRPLAKVARDYATSQHPGYTIKILAEGAVYPEELRKVLRPLPR